MQPNPFHLPLQYAALAGLPGAQPGRYTLSALRAYFADTQAVEAALAQGDPVLYEFASLRDPAPGSLLVFGITTIHPGKVGGEYHMTRGHFHQAAHDGDEIYTVLGGQGLLLLESRQGQTREMVMCPGELLYTPAGWAHRSVNTGPDDLVFLSVWPGSTAYDYETIRAQGGFAKRVVEQDGQPCVIDRIRR